MIVITGEELHARALHPSTWLSWIPEDIQEKIPVDTRVQISSIDGDWVMINEKGEIVFTTTPCVVNSPSVIDNIMKLFAQVTKNDAA